MARIEKARTKSFIPDNPFSNARVSREPSRMAPTQFAAGTTLPRRYSNNIAKRYQQEHGGLGTYSPLLIKGKAQKVFDKAARPKTPAATDTTTATDTTATTDTTAATGEGKGTQYSEEIEALLGRIGDLETQLSKQPELPDFESIFAQQAEAAAAQRQADLESMQQQQALAMNEMAARQMEYDRQRQLAFQTSQANTARAGMTPDFRIGGQRSNLYGTGGFKRRRRIRPATIAQGIAPMAAVATGGATTGNLLNV